MEVDDQLTEGKRRTVRVHIAIIDYFTQILRDLLSSKIAAKDLYKNNVFGKYKTSDNGKILGSWEDIFKREGHLELIKNTTDYADFDITLLYQFLRNFCTWAPNEKPTSGWGRAQMPTTGEETVGDDIERIRILRNKFYGHIRTFEIAVQEYEDCWTIISDVCKRMEKHIAGTSYYQDIKKIEKQHLDLDSFNAMKRYIGKNTEDIVKEFREQQQEVKSSLQSMEGELKSIKRHLIPQTETDIFGNKRIKIDIGILSNSNLADLARKIGKEYVLFLCHLNLSMPEIEQIQQENPYDIATQVIKGLALWKNKEQDRNSEVLVKDLLNALEKNDRRDLVDEIKERNKFQVTIGDCRKENNDLTIVCNISSTTDLSFSVTWERDGSKIDIDGSTEKYTGGNQSEPSLTIHNFEEDCGKYQCFVTSVMETFHSNFLNLNVPQVSLTGPTAVNLEELAIFKADYSSDLDITSYTWQRGAPTGGGTTLDIKEVKYTGSSIDKLVINGATFCDGAQYKLLVENIVGEGQSNGIQLIVKDIFGKKELWKNNDKCDSITKTDHLKLYRKLFWNTKENTFSCTVEELCKHLDLPYEYENLEYQDDNTEFDSEDSEKMTLWDFLHENGDITKNIKFWFAKSSDYSIIERYCVSSEYSRQEKETAICIPSEFLTEFVKKLDFNILKHRTMNDESIYPCVSDILKIPTEILYSGDDAVQNYLKQLSKGNMKVYHARGMIVGCAGAGKTTLLKKLKDLPIEDIRDTESTRGIDIQADVFTVSGKEITVTSEKILTHFNIKESTTTMTETLFDKQALENSPDELQTNLVESGQMNEQGNSTNRRTEDSNDQSFVENPSDNVVVNKLSFENTYLDSQLTVQTGRRQLQVVEKKALRGSDDNVLNMQKKQELEPIQLRSLLSAIKDNPTKTITIFDFAGQLAYYVTHQIYLNPRAFYVLVIDMTKDLDDLVKEGALFVKWTYKELIQHWMKMIHAIHGSAPVIPVATHAEGKSKEDIKKFFVQIWNLIPEDIQKCHLDYKYEFAVELENSFGIANIKECISNIVSTTKHWGELRPSSWVMFENYLMKAKMKIKVMKFEDLWTENKKLDSEYQLENKDDMTKMLQFFHDTGTILYIDEDVLRDDIILDVPWFVDAFKHIITDSVHATEDLAGIRDTFSSENFACKKALDDLKESGILSVSLVRAVWELYENMKSDKKRRI